MQPQQLQESISPPAYLILASLVVMPRTATALHEAVIHDGGQVIEPGTFSRLLERLERRGWIASYLGEGLREYHLTEPGMLALQMGERRHQERYIACSGWRRGKECTMRLVLWILRL